MSWSTTSIRTRTTLAAVLVVAAALLVGAAALVFAVRDSLRDSAESAAEQQVDSLAAQLEAGQVPPSPRGDLDDDDEEDDEDDLDDVVWQVVDRDEGFSVASSGADTVLPEEDGAVFDLMQDHPYVVARETVDAGPGYVVTAAVSLEDVDETTAALVTPLLVGLPALLAVLGLSTWLIVGRALRPVDEIRREVDLITGAELERRVPEPAADDEIGRLARTMNDMLARLQRARDRQEQFVGDASHELRSPLSSLRQVAEVARAHPEAVGHEELSETVLEEALRMQAIVDQLLLLARMGDGRPRTAPTEIDLDDLVLSDVRRIRRLGLTVDATGVGAARVVGDAVALGQVVRNLVDNAARHAEGALRVSLGDQSGGVVLTVEDDGAGIPEPDRDRVFDRFVRLDDARTRDAGGSGLGLAIVREVVTAHGGSVTVDGSDLGGARFVVRLPARPA
ncbi:sensor histidine kinase [Nocardioides caeni]|uniref:sensor histidine kinase n=1 Tax=Nocardioides caeni TaxID=574700 RepID=UPI001930F71A|nr:HAMP domain-containing sensor histidine kinase [Nocardioides caeni]